jgi:hypothetical protein
MPGLKRGVLRALLASGRSRSLFALTGFSALSFLETAVSGGEAGVNTGFGIASLIIIKSIPATAQRAGGRSANGTSEGWLAPYVAAGGGLQAYFTNAAGTISSTPTYQLSASDVGRVMLQIAYHDGSTARQHVNRIAGATSANIGYLASASRHCMGSMQLGSQPGDQLAVLSQVTFRGNPTQTQFEAYFDAARATGDLPGVIAGATVTHRWSLRDELIGVTDTTGKKTYGVYGTNTTNCLQTANPGGTAGSLAGGLWVVWYGTVYTLSDPSNRFPLGRGNAGLQGWVFQIASTGMFFRCGNGSALVDKSLTIPTSDLGVPAVYLGMIDPTTNTVRLFYQKVEQGAGVAIAAFSPLSKPTLIGNAGNGTDVGNSGYATWGAACGIGALTAPQISAIFDSIFATGSVAGLTTAPGCEHVWDVSGDIVANGGAIPATVLDRVGTQPMTTVGSPQPAYFATTGPACPAQLTDRITGAVGDALAKQGVGLTIKKSDLSIDGRRTLGAQGFSLVNRLQTVGAAGIRGNATAFWGHWYGRLSVVVAAIEILAANTTSGGTGWQLYLNTSGSMVCTVGGGTATSANSVVTAADLFIPQQIQFVFSSGTISIFYKRQLVATATGVSFVGSATAMILGGRVDGNFPATNTATFGFQGGDGYAPTFSELQDAYDATDATGRLQPIAGSSGATLKTQHTWDFTTAILATGIDAVPMQVLDTVAGGLDVHTDANAIRGIGPYSAVEGWQTNTGGGIQGQNAGFHVVLDLWFTKLPTSTEVIAHCANAGLSTGWFLRALSGPILRASIGGIVSADAYTLTSADLNKRLRVIVQKTATVAQLYVMGPQIGVDQPAGTFNVNSPALPMQVGQSFGASGFGSGYVEVIQGGNTILTSGEIAVIFADLTLPPPITVGKTQKRYIFEQDIAANAGVRPPWSVERISGGDDLVRFGNDLARQSIDVRTGPGGIRGVGPYGPTDGWQTVAGGGIAGVSGGLNVEVQVKLNITPTATGIIAQRTNGSNAGWEIYQTATVIAFGAFDGGGAFRQALYTLTAADLGQTVTLSLVLTGTVLRGFVRGVQASVDQFCTGFTPYTGATVIGQANGGVTPCLFSTVFALQGGNVAATNAEIAAMDAATVTAGTLQAIPTKTSKQWIFETDVAAVSGALPSRSVERVSGGDDLLRFGSGLTLAQRTERSFSWETAPIMKSATPSATNRWESVIGLANAGDPTGFFVAPVIRCKGATSGRFIANAAGGPQGWNWNGNSGALLQFSVVDGSGANKSAPTISVAPDGKIRPVLGVLDIPASLVRTYANHAQVSTGVSCTGYTMTSLASIGLCIGAFYGGSSGNTDWEMIGLVMGYGVPTFAEFRAWEDACIAAEDVVALGGAKSAHMYSAKRGMSGTTLLDLIGTAHVLAVGAPTTADIYSRAFAA